MGLKSLLIGLTLASTILGGSANAEQNSENSMNNRAYVFSGSSSNSNNPFHLGLGISHYLQLSDCLSAGLELNTLLENKDNETSIGITFKKEFERYTLSGGIGISDINFDEPMHISGESPSEPISETSLYLRGEIGKQVSNRTKIIFIYTKNFADEELFNHNYPHNRISLGLETSF